MIFLPNLKTDSLPMSGLSSMVPSYASFTFTSPHRSTPSYSCLFCSLNVQYRTSCGRNEPLVSGHYDFERRFKDKGSRTSV